MTNLSVEEQGPQTAGTQTIVWLPGGGVGGWMWAPQLKHFTDYHCLVLDLPGSGKAVNESVVSIEHCAAQVADVIRSRAHSGKAHVVGLSLGAQTTVALLALAPELVDHAVITGTLVRPIPGGSLMKPGLIRFLYRYTAAPFQKLDWWARLNMKYSAGMPDSYFPQFRDEFRAMTEDSFLEVLLANQAFRLPAGLDRVTSPVLVLAGQKERRVVRESARDLVAALPHAQGYVVSQPSGYSVAQSHNWSLNLPELFNATVRAWITDTPLPTALVPLG